MVRLTNVGLLLAVILVFGGANAFADGLFGGHSETGGDDPVLCCQEASLPTVPPTTTDFTGVFIFKGCKAIDPGPAAFNRCDGLVVNCAETPAACVSDSKLGGKDCLCGINLNLSLLINVNVGTPAAVLRGH